MVLCRLALVPGILSVVSAGSIFTVAAGIGFGLIFSGVFWIPWSFVQNAEVSEQKEIRVMCIEKYFWRKYENNKQAGLAFRSG